MFSLSAIFGRRAPFRGGARQFRLRADYKDYRFEAESDPPDVVIERGAPFDPFGSPN
jgi:hypothetical protein